jgi:hypothetical protein
MAYIPQLDEYVNFSINRYVHNDLVKQFKILIKPIKIASKLCSDFGNDRSNSEYRMIKLFTFKFALRSVINGITLNQRDLKKFFGRKACELLCIKLYITNLDLI